MRATLTTISVVGLLAAGAGPAAARPNASRNRIDAANHAALMRAQGAHYAQLTPNQALRDHEHGLDQPAAASPSQPAPVPIVHVTRLTDGGFDWADAGIGAGLAAALLLSAAGASALRRQHPAVR